MRLRRQELPTLNVDGGMEDSGGMTPAMDNSSSNKRSFGQHQHCNAIVSFVMKQKNTLIRFVMAISLIFVGGFMKLFSSAAVVDSSAHVEFELDTSHPSLRARVVPRTCTMLLKISRGERKSSLTRLSEIGRTLQQLILV